MFRRTAALVAVIAVLCSGVGARAEQRRIAVLQPDEELLRAVSLALAPWDIDTVPSQAPLPRPSQPEAVQAAARLARQLDVEALVWVTRLEQGSLLWVFDVATGDVTTRMLSESPRFDSAAAAAVALTVKTVLRASAVAPPEERFGASAASPAHRNTALEVGFGRYWLADHEHDHRLRIAALFWFPAAHRWGLSLEASSGPGLRVEDPEFSGRYRELVVGAKLRLRVVEVSGFSSAVALGGAARWAVLEGTLTEGSHDRKVDRLNGSLDLEASVSFEVSSRIFLGAALGTAYIPAYQRYLVDGAPVLSPWPLVVSLLGVCGVELF